MSEPWEAAFKELGYDTEFNMLHDLYEVQHMSLREIAVLFGVGTNTVRQRIHASGIKARPRGGKNRLGMSRVRKLPDSALEHPEKSARELGLHPSALYKEKRRRKDEQAHGSQSGASPEVPGRDVVGE